jgi:hypothetical protein
MNRKRLRTLEAAALRILLCTLVFSACCCAARASPPGQPGGLPPGSVHFLKDAAGGYRLAANDAALAEVLGAVADTSGVPIHHAALPEGTLSVACEGGLQTVLICLLGSNANLVVRYADGDRQVRPAEIWLLQGADRPLPEKADNAMAQNAAAGTQPGDSARQERTDDLLQQADDPARRLQAVAALAVEGRENDAGVGDFLRRCLSDTDAGVRAQAVFALARREGPRAAAELQLALQDENADVRMMAVDSAGDDRMLLQQALQDSDANIRQLAAAKLSALDRSGGY